MRRSPCPFDGRRLDRERLPDRGRRARPGRDDRHSDARPVVAQPSHRAGTARAGHGRRQGARGLSVVQLVISDAHRGPCGQSTHHGGDGRPPYGPPQRSTVRLVGRGSRGVPDRCPAGPARRRLAGTNSGLRFRTLQRRGTSLEIGQRISGAFDDTYKGVTAYSKRLMKEAPPYRLHHHHDGPPSVRGQVQEIVCGRGGHGASTGSSLGDREDLGPATAVHQPSQRRKP